MQLARALCTKRPLRNLVILIVLGASFFTLPVRRAYAGLVIASVPCFDISIDGVAFCISTALCVDFEGVTDILISPLLETPVRFRPSLTRQLGLKTLFLPA